MRNPVELKRHKTSSFDRVLYLIALKLQPDDSLFVILENDDFT